MDHARILIGGLAAGVVINLTETLTWALLVAEPYEAMTSEIGLTEATWAMAAYVTTAFALGIALAWIYAAIRPRFGPGKATALKAGAVLWTVAWLIPVVWNAAMGMAMDLGPRAGALALEFGGVMVAALVAGWIYREGEGAGA